MFIFSNLFTAIASLLDMAITLYIWAVIIRVIISWVNPDPYNQFVQFFVKITEPTLGRIRRFIPSLGGIDISPMVLIIGLYIAKSFLVNTFQDPAGALR